MNIAPSLTSPTYARTTHAKQPAANIPSASAAKASEETRFAGKKKEKQGSCCCLLDLFKAPFNWIANGIEALRMRFNANYRFDKTLEELSDLMETIIQPKADITPEIKDIFKNIASNPDFVSDIGTPEGFAAMKLPVAGDLPKSLIQITKALYDKNPKENVRATLNKQSPDAVVILAHLFNTYFTQEEEQAAQTKA